MKNQDILSRQNNWRPIRILNKLKTFIVCAFLLTTFTNGYAQVDQFRVGPYIVNYIGEDDHPYDLVIDSMQLYDFYHLKRDTVINVTTPTKLKRGVQIVANTGVSGLLKDGGFTHYDISGNIKQQLDESIYLNAGLSAGLSTGEYGSKNTPHYRKDQMIEIGIPVSLEVTNIYQDFNKSSLYGGVGFTPTFYKTTKIDDSSADKVKDANVKDFGILVTPRVDFGAYIPVFGQILRVGIYGEYRICCFQNVSIYKKRVSKSVLGVNVGLVF